jgi:hypothetical protein
MNCPHCGIAFHDDKWSTVVLREPSDADKTAWLAHITRCPACHEEIINLEHLPEGWKSNRKLAPLKDWMAYPRATNRKPTPKEVPEEIKEDYEEACLVLSISNKASAALSRRCLQAILRGQGYMQRDWRSRSTRSWPSRTPRKRPRRRFERPWMPSGILVISQPILLQIRPLFK